MLGQGISNLITFSELMVTRTNNVVAELHAVVPSGFHLPRDPNILVVSMNHSYGIRFQADSLKVHFSCFLNGQHTSRKFSL